MPTYEYKCQACGHEFEKFQSITAGPIRKCPKCGKNKVKRLLSAGAGLIFKGSGFYITDYRSEQYKNAAKSEAGASGDKAAEKSDSKPAADKPAAKTESTPASSPSPAPAKKESPRGKSKEK
ncbi:MAG TPA: zinc ribbon domain-containing protein [Tepidisphaeraceae bacterium]|jgi:putative FmdB family regulatory protein